MINALDPKDNWFLQRHSKFTSSVIFKLVPTAKDGTSFSTTGWSYIREKAIEEMTELYERPELEFVESLIHGKMYEEAAYNEYIRVSKNYNMRHFGGENPVFIEDKTHSFAGGSPDGLQGEGDVIDWGLEIKCPKNSNNHYLYSKFKDQWDLKEKRIEYYSQIQHLLMVTGANGFHFCSYDQRFKDKSKRLKIIEVLPDKKFQDNLDIRIQMAQKEKLKIIREF